MRTITLSSNVSTMRDALERGLSDRGLSDSHIKEMLDKHNIVYRYALAIIDLGLICKEASSSYGVDEAEEMFDGAEASFIAQGPGASTQTFCLPTEGDPVMIMLEGIKDWDDFCDFLDNAEKLLSEMPELFLQKKKEE